MSVNEVPGWLVLIVPRLIGVPVAVTPGLVPHEDVETVLLLPELDDAAGADEFAGAAALLELELELELHAARTPSDSAATAAAAVRVRQWTDLFMCPAFSWLTACRFIFRPGPRSASRRNALPGG